MTPSDIRNHLIKNGIKNLKEFGYEAVTEASILTDVVYSQFFTSMLRDNLGYGFDAEIKALIAKIPSLQDKDR